MLSELDYQRPGASLARTEARTGTGVGRSGLRLALLVISAAQLMMMLDTTVVNIALPAMGRALHFSPVSLQRVITAYALTFAGLLLFGGRTGDTAGLAFLPVTALIVVLSAVVAANAARARPGHLITGGRLIAAGGHRPRVPGGARGLGGDRLAGAVIVAVTIR